MTQYVRNRPTVYLCGPVTGLTHDEARLGWRKWMKDELAKLGIDALSPLRYTDHLKDVTNWNPQGYPDHILSTAKAVTLRDRWDTQRCDLVFANLLDSTQVSIGSMIEVGWCDSMRIPMIIAMEDNNVHDHAMVREIAIVVSDLNTALNAIRAFLIPGV